MKHIDTHLVLALLLAPIVWFIIYVTRQPPLNLLWPLQQPMLFLIPVLIYPILEEIIFRGALQGWLRDKTWGILTFYQLSYANICTSFIFSLAHLYNHEPLWAAAVFFPSLLFGYFRDRYNQHVCFLFIPIVLHSYYNMGWLWLFNPI